MENIFIKKILVNVGAAFILGVQTIYGYCNVGMVSVSISCVQSVWLMLHTSIILTIIYYSSLLTKEVKNFSSINNISTCSTRSNSLSISSKLIYLWGKRTARIVHDIRNSIHDSDVILVVRRIVRKASRFPKCCLIFPIFQLVEPIIAFIAADSISLSNFKLWSIHI